ncbi:MAG: porin [Oceanospirillales bacterium]|nr:porin [Oceanospirillales bacterium]
MKKSLIALAVAGAMAAPMVAQADATLYGKFEMRVKSVSDADLEVESDDFRVGVKGDVDLGLGDTKGLFRYETEINPEDSSAESAFDDNAGETGIAQRLAYVGATGSWGTALIGRINNPAEAVVGYTGNLSEDTYSDLNPDRLGSAIAYVSPSFSGLSAYAAMVAEGQNDDSEEDMDGYVLGADYAAGGLNLSVAYWEVAKEYVDLTDDVSYTAVGGSYTLGNLYFGLGWQQVDVGEDADLWGAKVAYTMDALTVAANYHDADDELGFDDQYSLNAVYSLGKSASLDAEFVSTDIDGADDRDTFSVGYTIKF